MRQAIIQDGKVINIIEIMGDTPIGLLCPTGSIPFDCGQYPVAIGDDFVDGVFTREGEALTQVPTTEQRVTELTEIVDTLLMDQLLAEGVITL